MTKVIVFSTVLGLSALGMACGEAPTNTTANNANKMAVNVAPVSTPAPAMTPANTTPSNMMPANNSAMKPANSMAANNSAMKPAVNSAMKPMNAATPAANAMKKP